MLNLKSIATYFCILNSKVCSDMNQQQIKNYVDKNYSLNISGITKEEFIKIPMWFDENEKSINLKSIYNK
jgi:hypothetical protein